MDLGPVDETPNTDERYDDPLRSLSPERNRGGRIRGDYSRSHSRVPKQPETGQSARPTVGPDAELRPTDRESRNSAREEDSKDVPVYYQVGAESCEAEDESSVASRDQSRGESSSDRKDASATTAVRHRIHKYTLYETNARYWITGADFSEQQFSAIDLIHIMTSYHCSLFPLCYDDHVVRLGEADEPKQAPKVALQSKTSSGFIAFVNAGKYLFQLLGFVDGLVLEQSYVARRRRAIDS